MSNDTVLKHRSERIIENLQGENEELRKQLEAQKKLNIKLHDKNIELAGIIHDAQLLGRR